MAAVNDTRQSQMTVDLGGEQVLLERARCTEVLGQPFTLQVDIIATLGEIDLLPHLGKPIAVHVYEDDELQRHFHGLITAGEFAQESGVGFHHYRLVARPFTYFLSQNRDMAIFQDMSVPDIIKKVFGNAGVSDFKLNLSKSYPPRTYCVQYRESDFTFLTRLMEEEGIYYFWKHDADKHTMVLVDAPSAHEPGTPASLEFSTTAGSMNRVGSGQRSGGGHYLDRWGERVVSGGEQVVTLRAFDFEKPERPLQAQANDAGKHPGDSREVYSYPGRYVDEARGKDLSDLQLTALRRDRQVYAGHSQAIGLMCGGKVSVTKHPTGRLNAGYLITRTEHVLQAEEHRSDQGNFDAEEPTHVTFEAMPAGTVFHLPQITPKPVVQGLETAIVSGPAGEEIYTDEYGRVKVRFHWDRADTTGEKSTCWIRVAQFGGLGNIILPRIDQEVMVDFLHGNPDDPIVVGWVFNKSHMPIYKLPANKTRALWRTKSYMGGESKKYPDATELDTGSPGANELRFEDLSGSEEVFLHAEKDMNVRTRNDQTNHVAHNQTEKVFFDRDALVGRDEKTVIHRNQTLTVETGDQIEEISQGNRKVTVKQGNDTLKVAMGNIKVTADMGKIEIEAMQSITLTVGQSKITIDQTGIKLGGMMIGVDAKIQYDTKGLMTQQTGSAMHTVKGGVVMIN